MATVNVPGVPVDVNRPEMSTNNIPPGCSQLAGMFAAGSGVASVSEAGVVTEGPSTAANGGSMMRGYGMGSAPQHANFMMPFVPSHTIVNVPAVTVTAALYEL